MRSTLEILLDSTVVMEFDRHARLPGKQREFLIKMDNDMDQGIELDGKHYPDPDILQRGKYVAVNLVHAIQVKNRSMMIAMCAYLVTHLPTLKQIVAEQTAEIMTIKMNFDVSN
ncbi:hypothetical protein [Kaarinaea lacus]